MTPRQIALARHALGLTDTTQPKSPRENEMSDIVEVMAEALWEAESVRATDKSRRIAWCDENYSTRDKWRYMARVAIEFIPAGYEIVRKDTRSATDAYKARASGIFHEREDFEGR